MIDEIMTPKQLQEYLHCSKTTAYELCKRKDFPSFRVGKSFYIYVNDLHKWIEKECRRDKW